MVWSMRPTEAGFPDRGAEDDHGQEEEDAGDLKPKDSADAAEGAQKSANAAGDAARCFTGCLAGGTVLSGNGWGWWAGYGLCAGGYALACHASGDAESDAEGAANGLRLHFEFDGNSAAYGHALHRLASTLCTGLRPGAGCSKASLEVR